MLSKADKCKNEIGFDTRLAQTGSKLYVAVGDGETDQSDRVSRSRCVK